MVDAPPPSSGLPHQQAAKGGWPAWTQRPLRKQLKYGVVALVAANFATSLYSSWKSWKEFITLPAACFIEVDLEQQRLVERGSSNPLKLLAGGARELELQALVQALKEARSDARVRGLMLVLGGREGFGGVAQLQELRNALLDFRFHARGRAPVYAYSNAFGEGGSNGTGLFYLASAADRVFMPPSGMLSLLGFETTQVFIRGLLDKLQFKPEVFRREEYKNALAPVTSTGFDGPHRQNITELLGSLSEQIVEGISSARKLPPAAVQAAIDAAPLLPQQALQLRLVDQLAYRDQVEAQLRQHLPPEQQQQQQQQQQPAVRPSWRSVPAAAAFRSAQLAGPRVSLQRYLIASAWTKNMRMVLGGGGGSSSSSGGQEPGAAAAGSKGLANPADRPIVVVLSAVGPIMQSSGGGGPSDPTGERSVESHRLVRVLRSYRENPQVKAVVLRIDSPGGSAVASDQIAREIALVRGAGKPVVACMGDVAASGGYFIAAPCNRILAQPGTITGSIGVIALKVDVREGLAQYGIAGESVALGANATWASPFHELTAAQRQQVEGMISSTYEDFLGVVARGRGMSKEAVRQVAKGRVWTGQQALQAGLVDELGGVARAVEAAKQLAGLPAEPEEAVQVVEFPPRTVPPVVKLLQAAGSMPGSAPAEAALQALAGSSSSGMLAAAATLVSMFVRHALWSSGEEVLPGAAGAASSSSWAAEEQQQLWQLLPAGVRQHLQLAIGGHSSVQAQVLTLLQRISQAQHQQQPQALCMQAELLARAC